MPKIQQIIGAHELSRFLTTPTQKLKPCPRSRDEFAKNF